MARADTPATFNSVSKGSLNPSILVILTPFSSTFLTTISSPIVSRQRPNTSKPQATLATVAGENSLISLLFI